MPHRALGFLPASSALLRPTPPVNNSLPVPITYYFGAHLNCRVEYDIARLGNPDGLEHETGRGSRLNRGGLSDYTPAS